MRAYLRRFRAYRALEAEVEYLRAEVVRLQDELAESARSVKQVCEDAADMERTSAELTQALEVERARRVAAESIAAERKDYIEHVIAELGRSNDARDAAVNQRMASIDLVNTALLKRITPESVPTDIKEFTGLQELLPQAANLRKQRIEGTVNETLSAIVERRKAEKKNQKTVEVPVG